MSKKVLKIKYKIIQILTDKTYPIMTEIIIYNIFNRLVFRRADGFKSSSLGRANNVVSSPTQLVTFAEIGSYIV